MDNVAVKSFSDFKAAHDPMYEVNAPDTVFDRVLAKGVKRFIITAAQNATPVHANFFAALKVAARHLDAELLIVPIRYKNPTSAWSGSQQNAEYWAAEARPFLWNQRLMLNPNLVLLGDVKTQPTAAQPLSGFEAITMGESGILAHTKIQLRSIATPQNRMAKLLVTTGACTLPNYTDSKTGKLGEFHHTLGAVLVEVKGKKFFLRHINADKKDGSFIDLDKHYLPTGAVDAPEALALIMGDTHVDFIDPKVEKATFGKSGIVQLLKPKHLVWHDLLDGYSVNPHHNGNVFNAIAKRTKDRHLVRQEVERACQFVASRTPKGTRSVVVSSNHDDFLRRWIVNTDWREDPDNADFYLETALAMVRLTKLGKGGTEYPSPFVHWAKKLLNGVRVLNGDESYTLAGVELGMHGDRGPNGARGSISNLRRIGVRSVVGHSHSPGVEEGCYQTGTSTHLKLEYQSGPSGWLNSHVVLYANGKRSHIHIIDGEWKL